MLKDRQGHESFSCLLGWESRPCGGGRFQTADDLVSEKSSLSTMSHVRTVHFQVLRTDSAFLGS